MEQKTTKAGGRFFLWLTALLSAVWLSGCATAGDITISRTRRKIRLPQSGELQVRAEALAPFGNVLPIKLSVTNVAPRERVFKQPVVSAITDSGQRIQELSLNDPAVVANGDGLLLEVGGGEGAMSEAWRANWDIPWGVMVAAGPMAWTALAVQSAMAAASSPASRLADYRLRVVSDSGKRSLQHGVEYIGYALFPTRHYAAVELTVVNVLTNNDECITVPLASATPTTRE
jgi:hypothetical protein